MSNSDSESSTPVLPSSPPPHIKKDKKKKKKMTTTICTVGSLQPFDSTRDDFEMWCGTFESFCVANGLDSKINAERLGRKYGYWASHRHQVNWSCQLHHSPVQSCQFGDRQIKRHVDQMRTALNQQPSLTTSDQTDEAPPVLTPN
ncbi:unnamed protein product [Orchesella dallaii]|uniref:Uncharacterized protein n=1 Tax=Orchesella dallaii TaxID=48710 RepID=A0ABP1SAV3_9HEXA